MEWQARLGNIRSALNGVARISAEGRRAACEPPQQQENRDRTVFFR